MPVDLAEHGQERGVKIGVAAVTNAAHVVKETAASVYDAGALTTELVAREAGVDFTAPLVSATSESVGKRMARGENTADITQDVTISTITGIAKNLVNAQAIYLRAEWPEVL